MQLYARCAGCKRDRFFVRKRTYKVPKAVLAANPHLSAINNMKSEGELCGECFRNIIKLTIPK